MSADLLTFLAGRSPASTESVTWGERMRLCATAYLNPDIPPLPYITSVRAVVLRDGAVLVQQDRHNRHVLPGGQRIAGETVETTLRREVAEETGWSLGRLVLLGFMSFHHLDPKPLDYPYPYPDFCWLVYAAEADHFSPASKLDDGYEVGSQFLSVHEAKGLSLTPGERVYLEAAIRLESDTPYGPSRSARR